MSSEWQVPPPWRGTSVEDTFSDLDRVFNIKGKLITQDKLSEVVLFEMPLAKGKYSTPSQYIKNGKAEPVSPHIKEGTRFYIKRYWEAGKGLRRFIGKSRIRSEWENMLFFHRLNIPAANVVGYGEERSHYLFKRGALITEELKNTTDLAKLAQQQAPELKKASWLLPVLRQIAAIARKLHDHRFIHTDFKWRNILVTTTENPQVALIDCPAGHQWPKGCLFDKVVQRGIIKDLACLDKVAKYQLSRSNRLYFFKQYTGEAQLSPKHKHQIRQILQFFEGRE